MRSKPPLPTITVEQLRRQLSAFPDHYTIDFCGLEFYRLKMRGEEHVQLEFNQPVYLDQHTGRVVVGNIEPDDSDSPASQ